MPSDFTKQVQLSYSEPFVKMVDEESKRLGRSRNQLFRDLVAHAMGHTKLVRGDNMPALKHLPRKKADMVRLTCNFTPEAAQYLRDFGWAHGGISRSAVIALLFLDYAGLNGTATRGHVTFYAPRKKSR